MKNKILIKSQFEAINSIVSEFISEFMNLCESEIEKLFFVNLFYYFFEEKFDLNKEVILSDFIYFNNFNPHYIFRGDEYYEDYRTKERKDESGSYYKVIGIELIEERSTILIKDVNKADLQIEEFKYTFIPQYRCKIEEKVFRLDIGVIYKELINNQLIKKRKLAIECDGFEFHSSREQMTNDSIRSRKLMKEGWKVIRYSGSEIHKTRNKHDINKLMKEIKIITNQ